LQAALPPLEVYQLSGLASTRYEELVDLIRFAGALQKQANYPPPTVGCKHSIARFQLLIIAPGTYSGALAMIAFRATHGEDFEGYCRHCLKHMEIDFQFGSDFPSFSDRYKYLLRLEWNRLDTNKSGFIQLSDYITLSKRLHEEHCISSWECDDEELKSIKREFAADSFISFRQFCLYAERDEIYDENEGVQRLADGYTPTSTNQELAYDQEADTYSAYCSRCIRHLCLDLVRKERYDCLLSVALHSVHPGVYYLELFQRADPNKTGYIDRAAFFRVLKEASEHTVLAHHQAGVSSHGSLPFFADCRQGGWGNALRLLQSECVTDEVEAAIRFDCEFVGDCKLFFSATAIHRGSVEHGADTHEQHVEGRGAQTQEQKWRDEDEVDVEKAGDSTQEKLTPCYYGGGAPYTYRVSLRQFCCFIERPCCDTHFPTDSFTTWLEQCAWSDSMHRVIARHWPDAAFLRQVRALLMAHRAGAEGIGSLSKDVLLWVVTYVPRQL
jgi:hypothetical protein